MSFWCFSLNVSTTVAIQAPCLLLQALILCLQRSRSSRTQKQKKTGCMDNTRCVLSKPALSSFMGTGDFIVSFKHIIAWWVIQRLSPKPAHALSHPISDRTRTRSERHPSPKTVHAGAPPRPRAPHLLLNKMPLDLAESRKIKDQGQGNH